MGPSGLKQICAAQQGALNLPMSLTYSLEQLPYATNAFWIIAANYRVIAFHGKIGVGKTTFIHALCEMLHVQDTIGSPTFSIINEYFFVENGILKKIFHIDLYRLKDEEEAVQAGVEDCLHSDHICFVEWPEKIPALLPDDSLHVHMEVVTAQTRKLRIGDN